MFCMFHLKISKSSCQINVVKYKVEYFPLKCSGVKYKYLQYSSKCNLLLSNTVYTVCFSALLKKQSFTDIIVLKNL